MRPVIEVGPRGGRIVATRVGRGGKLVHEYERPGDTSAGRHVAEDAPLAPRTVAVQPDRTPLGAHGAPPPPARPDTEAARTLQQNLLGAEDVTRRAAVEHVYIFGGDGHQLDYIPGDSRRAVFTVDKIDQWAKSGDVTLTHNHPSGSCFSLADVRTSARANLAETRASVPGGAWVLRRPEGGWPDHDNPSFLTALSIVFSASSRHANEAMDAHIRASGGTPGDPHARGYSDALFRQFATEGFLAAIAASPVAKRYLNVYFEPRGGIHATPRRNLDAAGAGDLVRGRGLAPGADARPEPPPAPLTPAPSLHESFGSQGAPAPGEKGYKPPRTFPPEAYDGRSPNQVAAHALGEAVRLYEDPEFAQAVQSAPRDAADLLAIPLTGPDGGQLKARDRVQLMRFVVHLAGETRPMAEASREGPIESSREAARAARQGRKLADADRWTSERVERQGFALPRWAAQAILEDHLEPDHELRLVNVGKGEADAFIREHHRTHPSLNPRGLMYSVGVHKGGRLVAVATAGHPTGRYADPRAVLELSRVASDGTVKGAASMLVARLLRLLPKSTREGANKPALFVTYSLSAEEGHTYRGLRDLGLRPVALVAGRDPGGARAGGDAPHVQTSKIRWEAGPGAAPARWDLLEAPEAPAPPRTVTLAPAAVPAPLGRPRPSRTLALERAGQQRLL